MTTTRFDSIFETEGRGLPVPFLRVLAQWESASNPAEATGPAWGLLQVGIDKRAGNVLKSYNERHGTSLSPTDMLNPRLNVRVASDLLSRIVEMYKAEGLVPDWGNGNWVGLIVAGWNSGYSRKNGTVKVIRWLRETGLPITHANVFQFSEAAGATKHLRSAKKLAWQRRVVESFLNESGKGAGSKGKNTEWLPLLLTLLLLR